MIAPQPRPAASSSHLLADESNISSDPVDEDNIRRLWHQQQSRASNITSSGSDSLSAGNLNKFDDMPPRVPASPSIAESTASSDCALDSPSSMSSSYSSRYLADVEDLELDSPHEPELETVSELDEESSSLCSISDRGIADSDDDAARHPGMPMGGGVGLGIRGAGDTASAADYHSSKRKSKSDWLHSQHQHALSHLHHLSHFSPRYNGHGLSSLARHGRQVRRHKGRIAEIVKEGQELAPTLPDAEGLVGEGEEPAAGAAPISIACGERDPYGEFHGPPALPARSVSPSETIPAVPSPLCVSQVLGEPGTPLESPNIPAPSPRDDSVDTLRPSSVPRDRNYFAKHEDTAGEATERDDAEAGDVTPGQETDGSRRDDSRDRASLRSLDSFGSDLSKSGTQSHSRTSSGVTTPPASPPASPCLSRSGTITAKSRRLSSPTAPTPKMPLRPCFRRRTSAASVVSGTSSVRDSSSDGESARGAPSRGRAHVRFSQAPPQEARTHSPVDYDRKSCPISNRLSPEDVEELRTMRMDMSLLEAKWAAMAACKARQGTGPSSPSLDDVARLEAAGGVFGHEKKWVPDDFNRRAVTPEHGFKAPAADYLSPASCASRVRPGFAASASTSAIPPSQSPDSAPSSSVRLSPAAHLRHERERERQRLLKARAHGAAATNAAAARNSSLIARFGLNTPPPPLPGMPGASGSKPKSGSLGSPDVTSAQSLASRPTAETSTSKTSSSAAIQHLNRSSSAPPTSRTESEERRATLAVAGAVARGAAGRLAERKAKAGSSDAPADNDEEAPRGRSVAARTPPALTHTSPSPSPERKRGFLASKSGEDRPDSIPEGARTPTSREFKSEPPVPKSRPAPPTPAPSYSGSNYPDCGSSYPTIGCGGAGYDSPASEFYESGSEYDLLA